MLGLLDPVVINISITTPDIQGALCLAAAVCVPAGRIAKIVLGTARSLHNKLIACLDAQVTLIQPTVGSMLPRLASLVQWVTPKQNKGA